ncbi:MAG: hypothetical protein AAF685_04290 [Cyanobacteria bacterium P01_C01_bin.89]
MDETWLLDIARSRHERYKQSPDRLVNNELEILLRHFPLQYRDEARFRIDQWYEESAHDPEDWYDLLLAVYPEHPIFEEIYNYPESYQDLAMLAKIDYKDGISNLRKRLLEELEERELPQDLFWVTGILSEAYGFGGLSLLHSIVLESELDEIRQILLSSAHKDISNTSSKEDQKGDCSQGLPLAIKLGWQDVIDALSNNESYVKALGKYDRYDMLWWSLTDKKQLVKDFMLLNDPRVPLCNRTPEKGWIWHQSTALAIAWTRASDPRWIYKPAPESQ